MSARRAAISRQGNYAGAVSRLVAFAADMAIAWTLILILTGAIAAFVNFLLNEPVKLIHMSASGISIIVVWYFLYFGYQISLGGRTLGMAIFGIKVVTTEGAPIRARQAWIRTLAEPLSFAIVGLGLIGIVFRRDHRAWHDRIARTCVVYDWDARAARMRWLARQQDHPVIEGIEQT